MHSVSLYSVHPTACAVALQCTTASVALVPVYVAGARAGGGSATTEVTTVSHQEGGLAQTPRRQEQLLLQKQPGREDFLSKKDKDVFVINMITRDLSLQK